MISKQKPIKIVIVGSGGFGREVLWTLRDCNKKSMRYKILGFIDDDKLLKGKRIDKLPVLGGLEWFSTNNVKDVSCAVAIGDCKLRYEIVHKIKKYNVKFPTIIHPSVIYSDFVEFGEGTIIQAGCILTVDAKIGNHVHINLDCTIGHDCVIEDFVTLTPGVHISGRNTIHSGVYFGTGAVTLERIEIGRWSVIGAGAVLIENVSEFSLYVGVPAKLKKKLDSF